MNLPPGFSCGVQPYLVDRIWDCVSANDVSGLEIYCRATFITHDTLHVKRDGYTVLHFAAANNTDPTIIALLVQYGARLNALDEDHATPLQSALYFGKVANAEILCTLGASVVGKDRDGSSAIHYAAHSGKVATLRLLLTKNIAIDAKDKDGDTALHICCELGHTAFAKSLIELHVDVCAANKTGWTPLHTAANKGHLDIVLLLLKAGAKVNAKTQDGWTALHSAARKARREIVVALLKEKGVDLSAKTKDGKTPYDVTSVTEKELRALLLDPKASSAGKPKDAPGGGAAGRGGGAAAGGGGGGRGGGAAPKAERAPAGAVGGADDLAAWLSRIGIAEQIVPVCGKLGLTSVADVRLVLESDLAGLGVPPVTRRKFMEAAAAASAPEAKPAGNKKPGFVPMPFPKFTQSSSAEFDGHAERLAVSFMKWLGYGDARTNGGVHVKDRGIDVISAKGVAQVKANFRGDVKRNAVSQLIGDASAPAYATKDLLFFAVTYSQDALSFVQELKGRKVMLFAFDGEGRVKAASPAAVQKVKAL